MEIRRVVTAENKDGKSYVKHDSVADNINLPLPEIAPNFKVANLWVSSEDSLVPKYNGDPVANNKFIPVSPEKNGTSFRIVNFPPENYLDYFKDPKNLEKFKQDAGFKSGELAGDNQRHPFMHKTETIDYAIILSGEIYLILDEEETLLKPQDVVVQCSTNHTWNNRSDKDCVIAFIVLGCDSK